MFTEINDKYYLNEMSMTILMADLVGEYARAQTNEGLEELTHDIAANIDAKGVVEAFKKNWRRPRDGSNSDIQDVYRSVPDAIQWAADRELERRADAAQADKYKKLLDAVFNGDIDPDDLYLDGHNDKGLF
jgi:hypothetical protein